jgi:hypothetical protein
MDRDRRLAEMMGLCGWYCTKCDKPLRPAEVTYEENCLYCGLHLSDPDFSLPEWRAKLMDFCVGQEWWNEFKDWSWDKAPDDDNDWVAYLWRNLPDLIVEYHGEGRE